MQFYATIFKAIANGLVQKPTRLTVTERRMDDGVVLLTVKTADGDEGQIKGKQAVRIQAFQRLFQTIAEKRGDSLAICVQESFGRPMDLPELPYDENWQRDPELKVLVETILEAIMPGRCKLEIWSSGYCSTVLIDTPNSPDDFSPQLFSDLIAIFPAWGKVNRRKVKIQLSNQKQEIA